MKRFLILGVGFELLVVLSGQPRALLAQSDGIISGIVLDEENRAVKGAVVRVKTTNRWVLTGTDGSFTLNALKAGEPIRVTAWMQGYYIGGGQQILPGASDVKIILKKHTDADNPGYQWTSAFAREGKPGNCENCHSSTDSDGDDQQLNLPFDEWRRDAHALSAQNRRFISMYLGQDLNGNRSPQTRYGYNRDYGTFPLRPDPTQPYYGPGYKLDFPNTSGNCAACHTPSAAIDQAYATDPTQVTGVGQEGVTCDFCHKVWDVQLKPDTGLPFANMPGVLSFCFRRPPEGHQFFAGPFDDVAPGEDTYTPIQRQSQYCAPCHFGRFWDTQIYDSFGEWLESPYSSVERATTAGLSSSKTCQDCHMPSGRTDHFARKDEGGVLRDPQTIFSHLMPGASSIDLLQNAVTMSATAHRQGDRIIVAVNIVNDKTGHHVPTDSPLRQMILLVRATDGAARTLSLQDGPTVPTWGGVGDPAKGYYAGQPGKAFAKILMELWTEITPTGAYWNPTRIVSDNRLAAFATDTSSYTFSAPNDGSATVEVRLLFRRAFKTLMDQKGWNAPDIVMEQTAISIP